MLCGEHAATSQMLCKCMLSSERNDAQSRLTKEAYTVAEFAKLLQPPVNPITIYRQVYAGNIKVLDGFGRIRIPRSEIERFFSRVSVYTPKKCSRTKQISEADVL
jgi:helix-turn-helix protein